MLQLIVTATNYKKFAQMKGLLHETVNERQKRRVKIAHPYKNSVARMVMVKGFTVDMSRNKLLSINEILKNDL